MNAAWKFQVPAFILDDQTLSEGLSCLIPEKTPEIKLEEPVLWDNRPPYQRYKNTTSGISPLAFPGTNDAIVKVDSYAHDESGIPMEGGVLVTMMAEKRLRKGEGLASDLRRYQRVNTLGNPGASTAILCWGSVRGVCAEVGSAAGLRVVQPVVLSPLPAPELANACVGVNRLIAVEGTATGQLAALVKLYGITVHDKILEFDGRPFTPSELDDRLKAVMAK